MEELQQYRYVTCKSSSGDRSLPAINKVVIWQMCLQVSEHFLMLLRVLCSSANIVKLWCFETYFCVWIKHIADIWCINIMLWEKEKHEIYVQNIYKYCNSWEGGSLLVKSKTVLSLGLILNDLLISLSHDPWWLKHWPGAVYEEVK